MTLLARAWATVGGLNRPWPAVVAVLSMLALLGVACQPSGQAIGVAPAPVPAATMVSDQAGQPASPAPAGTAAAGQAAPAAGYPREVTTAEAAAKRGAGAFILDVRQPDEWADYHVPGSTLIPLGELPARVNEVPRDKEVVVVCRSGNRSASGRDILREAGFEQVTSLKGGLSKWKAEGLPVVSGK